MPPTIAVTGGCGFIGQTLAKHLRVKFNVRVIDRAGMPAQTDDRIQLVNCDMRDYMKIREALADADLVIHTAIVQIPQIKDERRLGYEVNVIGTQNVCEAVRESRIAKGLILTGSWHTIGERNIVGTVDEKFGFRPDMVEDRARVYALSKIAQEAVVRLFEDSSEDKTYGVIRLGTVLGENMPEQTAANIFIERALKGQPLTPYEHSMHRPMLYVDVMDVCRAFESYAIKILDGRLPKGDGSLQRVVNVYYPEPITILEIAEIVKESVARNSRGMIEPRIVVTKTGEKGHFTPQDKNSIRVDVSKAKEFLGLQELTSPKETIDRIVCTRMRRTQ